METTDKKSIPGASKSTQKKPYRGPRLAKFGTVAQLTLQNQMGPGSDAGMNMMGGMMGS